MSRVLVHLILALAALMLTFMLAMMDYESKSMWDVFTAENAPALVVFTGFIYPILLVFYWTLRFISNAFRKPSDNMPGF